MTTDPLVRARSLAQQIAILSAELDTLLSLSPSVRSVSPPPRPPSPPSGPIRVGELVFITNKYGGNYGKRAKVIGEVGKGSFELKLLDSGVTLQKRRRNVSRSL